jgi:osmotically-inducible protein OsmY
MKSIKTIVHLLASADAGAGGDVRVGCQHETGRTELVGEHRQQIGDERREAQIWTTYAVNPHLKAHKLDIEVDNGTATLSGKVDSGAAKDLAEQIALGVDGIKKVNNNITVDANYEPPRRDGSERTFGDKVEDATSPPR